jgi:hypothetical protein
LAQPAVNRFAWRNTKPSVSAHELGNRGSGNHLCRTCEQNLHWLSVGVGPDSEILSLQVEEDVNSPALFLGTKGIPASLGSPMVCQGVNPFLLSPMIALLLLLCYYRSDSKVIASIIYIRWERFLTRGRFHAMV